MGATYSHVCRAHSLFTTPSPPIRSESLKPRYQEVPCCARSQTTIISAGSTIRKIPLREELGVDPTGNSHESATTRVRDCYRKWSVIKSRRYCSPILGRPTGAGGYHFECKGF